MVKVKRSNEKDQKIEKGVTISGNYFLLLVLGFVLFVIGITVLLVASWSYGGESASVGMVIFIGPFPIVIGAGPEVTWIVLFSIILAALSVTLFMIMNRKIRKNE